MAEALIDVEEARRRVLARAATLPAQDVALAAAHGRVLARDIVSTEAVPGFDNSAMDGFAVVAHDTAAATPDRPVTLAVVDESRAGRPSERALAGGEAIRISTGAMVPAGADAVVRVEDTVERDGAVSVGAAVPPGRNLRRAGDDVAPGDVVGARGVRVGPAQLGVLASVNTTVVPCIRRPRVVVLTTGDELRSPGEPLPAGSVRDTNAWSIPALAARAGAEVTAARTVRDDYDETVDAVAGALEADVVAICGGMSVGPHDHVKPALAALGVEQDFWGVALRPGKPAWFGSHEGRTLVFGLPGNPVSAMVTFHLFARPALAVLSGEDPAETRVQAVMDEPYTKAPGRSHAVRCVLAARDDGWHVRPTKDQGSHVLTSMLDARALALVERERGDVQAGERVTIELVNGG